MEDRMKGRKADGLKTADRQALNYIKVPTTATSSHLKDLFRRTFFAQGFKVRTCLFRFKLKSP